MMRLSPQLQNGEETLRGQSSLLVSLLLLASTIQIPPREMPHSIACDLLRHPKEAAPATRRFFKSQRL